MAKIKFKRKSTDEINEMDIEDGSLIYDYETGNTFMDYQNKRIQTGGKPNQDIYIGPKTNTPEEAKFVIVPEEVKAKPNGLIDSMAGNETNKSPSVHAIKEYYKNTPILNLKSGQNLQTSNSAYVPIPFNTILDNTANEYLELTTDKKGIKVLKDCVVMCNGSIYLNASGGGVTAVTIAINNYSDPESTVYTKSRTMMKIATTYDGFPLASTSFPVSIGDIIYFALQNGNGFTTNNNCFANIAVIGY